MSLTLFAVVLLIALASYFMAQRKALAIAGGRAGVLHSRPVFHGLYSLLWVALAGIGALLLSATLGDWLIDRVLMGRIEAARPSLAPLEHQLLLSDAKALAEGRMSSRGGVLRDQIAAAYDWMSATRNWVVIALSVGGAAVAARITYGRVSAGWRARNRAERIMLNILLAMATIAILTTVGIVLSLIFETVRFFGMIDWRIDKFILGATWSPLSGVFEGQMDPDKVGALPLFAGTLLITAIAMLVAVPIGLFSAIYLSDFAPKRVRAVAKPLLEILAGVPTVVYGFFAAITLAPALRDFGEMIGVRISSESALAAGLTMGIMIIPFISSLSDDVINAVPQSLRDGSLGVGATEAETMRLVVLPAALPGIVSAAILGVSKAIGETMIVVMAAGQGANLTANPLEATTTVTVQIVALITGDTDAETAAGPAFTLGFTLFVMTLVMNILAQRLVRRFREAYE
jgi:phosphate transport system permease protein